MELIRAQRACGDIDRGGSADCDNLPVGGTEARLILMNNGDIEGYTEDVDGNITGITLAGGAFAYEFIGFRNDMKATQEAITPEVGPTRFKHGVGLNIYELTQLQKNNIEKLARGNVVAIVENRGKDANAHEVFGKGVGLQIVPGVIRNAHENGGLYILSLATPDGEGLTEPKLPQTLAISGSGEIYANNLEFIETLLPAS
jgi:hypothetical protein